MEDPLRAPTDVGEAVVQIGQRGVTRLRTNNGAKAVWLENNIELSTATFAVVIGLLIPLLSSEYKSIQQHHEWFGAFVLWTALVAFLAGAQKVFTACISGVNEISHNQKAICSLLTLLTGTAVTSADLAVLCTVDKSYLYFAAIPVLQIVLIPWLSYLDLKVINQTMDSDEAMVKSCFKVASVVTPVCYAMQAALLYSHYSKAIDFSEGYVHYALEMTFLTSAMGCSTMIVASTPLTFQSNCVVFFLRKIPMIMSVFVWLSAAILSTKFLNATAVTFAAIVPIFVEIVVNLIWETCEQPQPAAGNIIAVDHSISGAVMPLGTVLIAIIYVSFGRDNNLHDRYLTTSSVFVLLSSMAFGLIRMMFPFCPDCKFAKRSVCSTLAIGLLLVGFYLILIEIMYAINQVQSP